MLCCSSALWWSLGQSLCRSRGCLTSGRFATSIMHLSSRAGRPHAHQRASSSAGAAAAAASTPACMSLPRACRCALASTSQAPKQTFQHNLPRRMHTCQVTALARSQTHLSHTCSSCACCPCFLNPSLPNHTPPSAPVQAAHSTDSSTPEVAAYTSPAAPDNNNSSSNSGSGSSSGSSGPAGPSISINRSSLQYAPEDTYDVIVVGAGHAGE